MRPPLLIALAVALAATLWLQQGEDTGGVEVAERRGPTRHQAAERPGQASPVDRSAPQGGRGGEAREIRGSRATGVTGATTETVPAATGAWLVDRVRTWQARRAETEALPPPRAMTAATPSAWSAALPPPPPPPPQQNNAADAAPVAPPFPHQWVGRFDDEASGGGKALRRAVISGPVSTWVAREGDVIEGQWRIDQIQERLMRLTYLPLQQSQTVAMK